MKTLILLSFSLLVYNIVLAQGQAIKITNQVSKKEIIIKENKRIKIETVDGKKVFGRFSIKDNMLFLDNQSFLLTEIQGIKRHPLLVSVLSGGIFLYGGIIAAGFGVLIGLLIDSTAFLLTIPAAGMIYAGIHPPNFNKKYKNGDTWTYEFITISNQNVSQ